MKIEKFEDISAWQKSRLLVIQIYEMFKNNRDFSFRDQIQRAGISIMNNIAEGFERRSNKELKNYLFIAKGSSAELRSMLYIALDIKYIQQQQFHEAYNLSLEISKMLSGFIKKLSI